MHPPALLFSLLATGLLALSASHGQASAPHVKQVTALTEVFGDGQKTVAALLEFDAPIQNVGLQPSDFAVAGRTSTRVYATSPTTPAAQGTNGWFIVIELPPAAAGAATFPQQGLHSTRKPARMSGRQLAPLTTAAHARYAPFAGALANTAQVNPVVDDFTQRTCADAPTRPPARPSPIACSCPGPTPPASTTP